VTTYFLYAKCGFCFQAHYQFIREMNSLFRAYPEYHPSGLSYSGGYDFGGGLGGHSSSGDNSLESGVGSSGGFGDFGHHHYTPHHHMGHGKQPNHKSIALKGLLVPLAGVALLGKINT
jgi:hypothetical protein